MGEGGEVRLAAEGITVRRGDRAVLSGVDLALRARTITGILGPNGAGKSTLLMALAGLLSVAEGSIHLEGRPLKTWTARERAQRLAYVPQKTALAAPLTVREVVELGRFPHRGAFGAMAAADRRAVDRALEGAYVTHLPHRRFDALSGGEQRRVLLARALATEASTILFDEPTASLDVAHALALHRRLRELAEEGLTIAVVLHDLDDARRCTDRALLLDAGRPVAEGPSPEVVRPEHVRAVYGVELVEGGALGFRLGGGPVP